MRARALLSFLALLVVRGAPFGCGGGGEAHQSDAAPPRDTAPDTRLTVGGGGGIGGAGGAAGAGGSVAAGAEIGAACAIASDCKSGYCFDSICCRSDCSGVCQSCAQPGSVA